MNKTRSSQLFDCDQKINEADEAIKKLVKKLVAVKGQV